MSIRLMRYEDSVVTATDDAILHNLIYPRNGIIKGMEMEYIGGAQISVSAGRGIIKGRDFEVEEQIVLAELTNGKDQPGRIIIRMDLANVDNPICFVSQVGTNGQLPELVKEENCNYIAGIYEIPIATYTAKINMITDFKVVYEKVVQWNVLKTREEVEANTNPDNIPSAVVVGEVINNLGGYSFGETADGKPGYRKPGADTVIPFSSAYVYKNVNLGTYKALQDGVAYLFFWSYASSGTYDGIIFTTTGSGKRIGYQSYSGQQSFLYQFNLKAGQTITTQPGPEYINSSNGTLIYPNGMF